MSPSPGDYRDALAAIEEIVSREEESDEIVRLTVEVLHDRVETYSWVGIYFVEGDELALGPWKGPHATDHVRIPSGQGVRGAAAASGGTEIVVPVSYDGVVVAEIDVDSDAPAAFGAADREFLERVAAVISPYCLVGWDTGGMDWDAPENWT
ncbi:MAG: GAF domain-containing protein [Gaiellales bacterium]